MTETDADGTAGESQRRDWVEIVATIVLAVAAVATAWSSYQATRWNGESTRDSGRVNALRIEAARAQGLAEGQTQVDISMFFEWINANVAENNELEDFYADRFRSEFRTAFDAWQATEPLTNAEAPSTPFAMDEYQLQARADAERLDAEAEVMAAEVRLDVQRAGNYVLGVVLFGVALFFAGMSTKLTGRGAKIAMVTVGSLIAIGAASWIATFPVNFAL